MSFHFIRLILWQGDLAISGQIFVSYIHNLSEISGSLTEDTLFYLYLLFFWQKEIIDFGCLLHSAFVQKL
jgi:hypothetical protein